MIFIAYIFIYHIYLLSIQLIALDLTQQIKLHIRKKLLTINGMETINGI